MIQELTKETSYVISHIGILKLISVWGMVEAFIYWLTKGNKSKEIFIHIGMFIAISIIAYFYPDLTPDLK
jgi:hypothetical protein